MPNPWLHSRDFGGAITIRRGWLLVLGSLIFIYGCTNKSTIQPEVEERDFLTVSATTVEPEASGVQTLEFSGHLRAAKSTDLGFLRSGRVLQLTVDEGDRVSAGQVLGRLDTDSLAARESELRAQLAGAEANSQEVSAPPRRYERAASQDRIDQLKSELQLARTKLQRREELYKNGAIPKEQLDEARTTVTLTSNQLEAARNQLKDLEAGARPETRRVAQTQVEQVRASLQSLQVDFENSVLISPYNAKVAKRLIDEGAIVSTGQPVYRLVTSSVLEAELFLPPRQAERLSPGDTIDVLIEGESYQATVKKGLPLVDTTSGTRGVLLSLPASGRLHPGQLLRVQIPTEEKEEGYWLPSTALLPGERGLFTCYTLSPVDGQSDLFEVKKQAVEVVKTTGEKAFVRGTLVGRPDIIVEGIQRVVPGQKVRRS